jgi:nucleoside-diphosphate-sugar epimerase
MTKVLVTGGAGYIGSILVPALLERQYSVTVIDNFMYGQDSLAAVCHYPTFSLIRGDVRSRDVMRGLVKTADIIIPLAALVGAPLCDRDPIAATSTNLTAIVDMLDDLSPEQRVLLPLTNSGRARQVLHRRDADSAGLALRPRQGRSGADSARPPPVGPQFPAGDGVRDVAPDAARPARQRLHLPRVL